MNQKQNNQWLKFSQMGFQMAIIIGGFGYLGVQVDKNFEKIQPYGAAFLSLLGVFVSFYLLFKELKSMDLDGEK